MRPSHRLTRRTVLGGMAATALASGVAGCGTRRRPIQVAVVWSTDELRRFQRVLDDFGADNHPARAVSVGDDIDGFLRARQLAGTGPDVAVLPKPGLVLEYARRGWLTPVEALPAAAPDASPLIAHLSDLLRVKGRTYGTWVKIAHKSLFWYHRGLLAPTDVPGDWAELVELVERLAGQAESAPPRAGAPVPPLVIGAADGWVLTDWFENVLAGVDIDHYEKLATGPTGWDGEPVRVTLQQLYNLWRIPGALAGGGQRALLTQFDDSAGALARGRAAMLHAGDFAAGVINRFTAPEEIGRFAFPCQRAGDPPPTVVGGDAAVVWRGSAHGGELVQWLADPKGKKSLRRHGFLPDDPAPPTDSPDPGRPRPPTGAPGSTSVPRFDLSDRLPAGFTGSDGAGIWRILQDFFQAATDPDGRDGERMIRSVQVRLARAADEAWPK